MKLVLGGAQIGMNYGYSNNRRVSLNEFKKIENLVLRSKIKFVDTAKSYGRSERVVGNSKLKKLNIITKIKFPNKKNISVKRWVTSKVFDSIKALKVKTLYGVLIHDSKDLLGSRGKEYLRSLQELKKRNIIKKIGISIYDLKEIKKILKFWKPDIVQFPFNIFDNRILNSKWLEILKKLRIKMYARSVFLQGTLIDDSSSFIFKKKYKHLFNKFNYWCNKNNITRIQACLHFVKQYKEIDYLIVGFNNYNQLKEIIDLFNKKQIIIPNKFSNNNINLIDPRKWN